jgi:hypothetical protein
MCRYFSSLSGVCLYPKGDARLRRKCKIYAKHMQLKKKDMGLGSCAGDGCIVVLIAAGAVSAASGKYCRGR